MGWEFKNEKSHAIFNGGKNLKNAPKSYNQHHAWVDKANKGKDDKIFPVPEWGSDCNYKTDFDGPIFGVNSRFYPPAEHYGQKWNGTTTIYLMGDEILEKKFDCDTFDELTKQVEEFVNQFSIGLGRLLGVISQLPSSGKPS